MLAQLVLGSFTGLRIGISTVKAFCDVTNIPVCSVSSLESLAYNLSDLGLIACMIDAKNENVYFALFSHTESGYTKIEDFCLANIHNIISKLDKYKNETIRFIGDATSLYHDLICANLTNISFANDNQNMQSSISVGRAAYDKFQKGDYGQSDKLSPLYLRKSQAERALDGEK